MIFAFQHVSGFHLKFRSCLRRTGLFPGAEQESSPPEAFGSRTLGGCKSARKLVDHGRVEPE